MGTQKFAIRKLASVFCALALALCFSSALAESANVAEHNLNDLAGTYVPLFEGATFDASCDAYWHDASAAVVGDSMADAAVDLMKASIGGSLYGQEAVNAYAENPDSAVFHCGFIGGVAEFCFDGMTISGTDADGNEIFAHTYEYVGDYFIGEEVGIEGFGGALYKSVDEDSDEFTYFLILPDTMDTTYHIEFRYGSNLDDMQLYGSGEYAYWLAAGISKDALNEKSEDAGENDATLRNVIGLFCAENLAGMTTEETAAQRADFIGVWDATEECLAALREETGLANADMYCEFAEDGIGATYVDMNGTGEYAQAASYTFFVYDNDGSDEQQSGIYIAISEEASEAVPYDIVVNEAGEAVLSLYAADGVASWTLRAE